MNGLSSAEMLLRYELGISAPSEIDLDVIAQAQGVSVRYRPLKGCEAQLVGLGDRAIALINDSSSPERKRFSLAHELGHWHYHRGRSLSCRTGGDQNPRYWSNAPEKVADFYAADLLMPKYLFWPMANELKRSTLKAAKDLKAEFCTSLLAPPIVAPGSNCDSVL